MNRETTAIPRSTYRNERSCSVRLVTAVAAADLRTSAMPRLMPMIRFLRIFQRV